MPVPRTILIAGPSAAGKTALALRLAETVPDVDLISVDSAMVYRGLDIGTAKPSPELLARFPHALVDIRDPLEPYSVGEFFADAKAQVAASHVANRTPVLVGGTMLYFKALRCGLSPLPPAHEQTRDKILTLAKAVGWPGVHEKLATIDPISAKRLSPNDAQRLQRALEVYMVTGRTLSSWWQAPPLPGLGGPLLFFALAPKSRARLHARIAERFKHMLAQGLIEEARKLCERPDLHDRLPALRVVGYRQVQDCLTGRSDWADLHAKILAATRQLAKQQLTWLKRWDDLIWLPEDLDAALATILDNF